MPSILVRMPACGMAHDSTRLPETRLLHPFKAKIEGSNPSGVTTSASIDAGFVSVPSMAGKRPKPWAQRGLSSGAEHDRRGFWGRAGLRA